MRGGTATEVFWPARAGRTLLCTGAFLRPVAVGAGARGLRGAGLVATGTGLVELGFERAICFRAEVVPGDLSLVASPVVATFVVPGAVFLFPATTLRDVDFLSPAGADGVFRVEVGFAAPRAIGVAGEPGFTTLAGSFAFIAVFGLRPARLPLAGGFVFLVVFGCLRFISLEFDPWGRASYL